jgi:hypothetical protein
MVRWTDELNRWTGGRDRTGVLERRVRPNPMDIERPTVENNGASLTGKYICLLTAAPVLSSRSTAKTDCQTAAKMDEIVRDLLYHGGLRPSRVPRYLRADDIEFCNGIFPDDIAYYFLLYGIDNFIYMMNLRFAPRNDRITIARYNVGAVGQAEIRYVIDDDDYCGKLWRTLHAFASALQQHLNDCRAGWHRLDMTVPCIRPEREEPWDLGYIFG